MLTLIVIVQTIMLVSVAALFLTGKAGIYRDGRAVLTKSAAPKQLTILDEVHNLVWLKIAGDYRLWYYKCTCGVVGKCREEYTTFGGTETQTFEAFMRHKENREAMQQRLAPPPPPSASDLWIKEFKSIEQSARR